MSTAIKRFSLWSLASILLPATLFAQGPPTFVNGEGVVSGNPSISLTADDGETWTTHRQNLQTGQGSFSIVNIRGTDVLLSEYKGTLYGSNNGGSKWRKAGTINTWPLKFAPTRNGAYAWGFFSASQVWKITLTASGAQVVQVKGLPDDVLTLTVDPTNDAHVRAMTDNGVLYDTYNSGASWTSRGKGAPVTGITYFADIDSEDLDHVICGMYGNGAVTSFDGGATWSSASGLTNTGGDRNTFNGVISPADSSVVWLMSLNMDEYNSGDPSGGKHIYRSDDGGLNFAPVIDQGNGIVLTNGPVMGAHPTDSNLLYFPFGSTIGGIFVNLYRYDHAQGQTTWFDNTDLRHASIRSIAFDPTQPNRVIAGFEGRR